MRTDKQLDAEVRGAIALCCDVVILAYGDDEAMRLGAMLKGRHGAKRVGIRRADPAEAMPIMDRVRGQA